MPTIKIKDFFIIIITTLIISCVLMNASIKLYLEQQHYEEKYPLLSVFEYLNNIPDNALFQFADHIKKVITFQNTHDAIPTYTQNDFKQSTQTPETPAPETSTTETIIATPSPNDQTQHNLPPTQKTQETSQKAPAKTLPISYTLNKGDKVVLIGDSLMQGVGMTLVSRLKKQGAKVINLSKQNTGLTYKKYFDWEQTLKDTLKKNPDIKYVIALFGANDPWDMPNPNNQSRRLKFKSKEWEEIYRQRIGAILTLAQQYNAHIFWYQIPRMKNAKLDASVAYLNMLYEEEISKVKGKFLYSNERLTQEGAFSTYITDSSQQKVKVRTNDGIHFTGAGSRILSSLLIDQLILHEQNKK